MPLLSSGDRFPSLTLTPPGQAAAQLPQWCAGSSFGLDPGRAAGIEEDWHGGSRRQKN